MPTRSRPPSRRLPVGAEFFAGRGAHVRVWAPRRRRVAVVVEDDRGRESTPVELAWEAAGYFSGWVAGARPGTLYRLALDDEGSFPDPVSRCQPRGPHGPSQIVDPGRYEWQDRGWRGSRREGQVIYEMHIGTFTREGTWSAASRHLKELALTGVTLLEVMPIAEFPGRFGWGYDGCNLFAPTRLYGAPDDVRRFVDDAHGAGLGVILDVVYNHLGPDGNFLPRFSPFYFSTRSTEWGRALNFDGPESAPVREYFVSNAAYWISEFHFDGLRFDATQAIHDGSRTHILADIARAARAAAGRRPIVLLAENETQTAALARPPAAGFGLDAVWNDDFHHAARVALSGLREAYYSGYMGSPQEFISCLLRGFLYQGQFHSWQGKCRGSSALDLPPAAFVHYLENHDQVANSLDGRRLHQLCDPGRLRALTAVLLLGPQTPMLFQGQEFRASSPFQYFADHLGELGVCVRDGRRSFLAQFPSLASPDAAAWIPDPRDAAVFERSKLDHEERARNAPSLALHRDLLTLRREDPVFHAQRPDGLAAAVLGRAAFVLRFAGTSGDDRLLIVNLGGDERLWPCSEPLLAPPSAGPWTMAWSSEEPRYGGGGARAPIDERGRWDLPGPCACVLRSSPHA
ncbi:MAG: malto-oligosyltrehalose trehalohydrolase [Elusimicrobia bacterium]|nr:malto-oligosyltrehalose trehalohydrolase [Elusimicrobiota bacterium]